MTVPTRLEHVDFRITAWMAQHGVTLTRLALGVVFVWFGAIKFVPGWSPAADLAARTIERLTLGVVEPSLALPLLAVWETLIGIGLITGRLLRLTLLLLFIQMPGTMLPRFRIRQRWKVSISSRILCWCVRLSSWARPCVEERYRCPRPRLRRSAPPNTRMQLRRRVRFQRKSLI